MTGFSFKNIVLQIIQGCIVLLPVSFIISGATFIIEGFSKVFSLYTAILLGGAFIIGVLIDFLADSFETIVLKLGWIKLPSYYLLNNGSVWGIRLAHHKKIKDDLIYRAKRFERTINAETDLCFVDYNNLVFQTAKNKAFKECSDYQKEHLESFFILYVFCRNLALSIIISFIILILFNSVGTTRLSIPIVGVVVFTTTLSLLASYRYFIYYSRMVLGATFNPSAPNYINKYNISNYENDLCNMQRKRSRTFIKSSRRK